MKKRQNDSLWNYLIFCNKSLSSESFEECRLLWGKFSPHVSLQKHWKEFVIVSFHISCFSCHFICIETLRGLNEPPVLQGLVLFLKSSPFSVQFQQVLLIALLSKQVPGEDAGISCSVLCSTSYANAKARTCGKAWIWSRKIIIQIWDTNTFSVSSHIKYLVQIRVNHGFSCWNKAFSSFLRSECLLACFILRLFDCCSCPAHFHKSLTALMFL